jgi:hypothetical protein
METLKMVPKQMQWNAINAIRAIKYSRSGMDLSDISVYTIKRLSDVRLAAKVLHEVTLWVHTEEFTLERNHILARFAISILHTGDPKRTINSPILQANRISVKYVTSISLAKIHSLYITAFTQQIDLINVKCAKRISYVKKIWLFIGVFIQERNHIGVMYVIYDFL